MAYLPITTLGVNMTIEQEQVISKIVIEACDYIEELKEDNIRLNKELSRCKDFILSIKYNKGDKMEKNGADC